MKPLLLAILLSNTPPKDSVLVCFGSMSYAYHRRICDGLARCSRTIRKMPLDSARHLGRSACWLCYPRQSR